MRVVYVQGVVVRTARRILVFVNVAEFRIRPKQLPLSNGRLIKAATARSDVAKKWVGDLMSARRSPSKRTWDPADSN